ncbi:MAG TPA: TetR/AcrR family transcriptional regulator [Thermoanaerobaculia bacterium]|nr:TetR/AcrR family transcriptional regulator [Thermoanaerobaculia bacterium]
MGRPPRISRDQLLETARSVFAAKGFDAATLADIARELHVTPAAVLRHTKSKLDLFRTAMSSRITAPPEFILELTNVDPGTDPRIVLRRIAEKFVPFVEKIIAENIAVYMHERSRSLVVPFDPSAADSPPRRGIAMVTDYFRRAMDAGVVRRGDPKAFALLFMGALQAYVFNHRVLNIVTKKYPLGRYIDALIDVWSTGAIRGGHRGKPAQTSAAPRHRDRAGGGGRGDRSLRAGAPRAPRARAVRDSRSANGAGRVARRRARKSRVHR